MRHVADSLQWRNIDNTFENFGGDIRNVRLGLSSDGINPFGNLSSKDSTWPILLCNYNVMHETKIHHDVIVNSRPKTTRQ